MGRAFRVVKRTAHLTVRVSERRVKVVVEAPAPEPGEKAAAPKRARGARPKAKPKAKAKSAATGARKKPAPKKKTATA